MNSRWMGGWTSVANASYFEVKQKGFWPTAIRMSFQAWAVRDVFWRHSMTTFQIHSGSYHHENQETRRTPQDPKSFARLLLNGEWHLTVFMALSTSTPTITMAQWWSGHNKLASSPARNWDHKWTHMESINSVKNIQLQVTSASRNSGCSSPIWSVLLTHHQKIFSGGSMGSWGYPARHFLR